DCAPDTAPTNNVAQNTIRLTMFFISVSVAGKWSGGLEAGSRGGNNLERHARVRLLERSSHEDLGNVALELGDGLRRARANERGGHGISREIGLEHAHQEHRRGARLDVAKATS